jgi:hypothetical protein
VFEYQLLGVLLCVLLGVLLGLLIRRCYSATRLLGRLVAGMQIYIGLFSGQVETLKQFNSMPHINH